MTMPDDLAGLIAILRATETRMIGRHAKLFLINPDGPVAATALETLTRERDQARADLAEAVRVIRIFNPAVARAFLAKHT